MPSVAIVILNWNGKKLLAQFLPNVIANSKINGVKIYIADNGSTDDSIEFINKNFPSINLLSLNKNYGFAEGYNRALKQITADYYILINSDIEVTSNWITPVLNYLESNEQVAAGMPKIRSFKNREYFEHAGACGGFIDKYGYPFCRGRIFYAIEKDEQQYDSISEIFWASGACLFIKANLFHKADGFDKHFFAHMEEIDLCWRLKNMGYKIVCFPQVTVYHIGGATLSTEHPRKTFYNFRNNLFLLYKNLPSTKLFTILFVRFILDGIAGIRFLLRFEIKNALAVVLAHLSFYAHLPIFIKKRAMIRKNVVCYNHNEIYNKSIIKDFYITGIKTFSNIKNFM